MQENMQQLHDLPEAPIVQEAHQEKPQEEVLQEKDTTQDGGEQSSEERNFAALRHAKEAAERERDLYYQRLQEIESKKTVASKADIPKREELGDDDLAEGRHLKEIKKELEEYKRQTSEATTEARVKAQFPDFDTVVNASTIERLKTAYPELASTLSASGDLYNKAASAYTLIKKLGIYDGKNHDANREIIQKNSTKPRPLSSVSPQQGDSPLSHANAFANGLTPELKQKLYKEMIESRRSS